MNDLTSIAPWAALVVGFSVAITAITAAVSTRKSSTAFSSSKKTGTAPLSVVGCPQQPERSEATRLLCTTAYHDERFADAVIEILLPSDLSAIAHSEGVDLRPVLLHCLASAKQRLNRDIGLVITLLLSTLLTFFLSLWFVVIGLFAALAFILIDQSWHRKAIFHRLRRSTFQSKPNPPEAPEPWVVNRLTDITEAQQGNVTVYSGYKPFIGFGDSESRWSFALPILPAKGLDGRPTGDDVIFFTTAELTEHIRRALSDFADRSKTPTVGERLEGLHLEERVFVNGAGLDTNGPFLLDRTEPPTTLLSAEEVSAIAADPRGLARYYLCAHVPSWSGQIVASTFLRFSTDGYLIYTEYVRTILAPVSAELIPEKLTTERMDLHELFSAIGEALINVVPMLMRSPWRMVRALTFAGRCANRAESLREEAAENLGFDYGISISIRELFVDTNYHNYYQPADASKHLDIVERHTLEALAVFLEEHRVDTTDLRSRQTAILNEGIIQTGGISNIGAQAVGRGAAASQDSPKSTAQTLPTASGKN